ncbi:MAG: DUF885 domain-containing protein [Candidatus Eisenbacteria bacterium]
MSAAFDKIVEDYVSTLLADYPVMATFLGVHDRDGELGEFGADAQKEKNDHLTSLLRDLEAIPLDGEPVEVRIDAAALRASLRLEVFEHEELRTHELKPYVYVGAALSGCNELVLGDFAPLADRARSLLGRLRQIPGVLDAMRENVRESPAVFATVGAEMARGGVGFARSVIPGIGEEVPELRAELVSAGNAAGEAFESAAGYLEGLAEKSEVPFHVGRERYEWINREYHMLGMDSAELRDLGRRMLVETTAKMEELAREIDSGRTTSEIIDELKSDHPSASGLRQHYAKEMARARDFVLEHDLVTVPAGEELEVIDTPVFLRKILPYAAYHPAGPFESKQRGLFYVTPADEGLSPEDQEKQLRGHSVHTIPVIALHEAYPGHHLQLVRSNLTRRKVRRLLWNTVFIEGWALYCEEMMKDAGFYTDARTRLGQLKETRWRAARVVVDVGLQLGEMSVDEAVEFMMSEVGLEKVNATAEVKRYTGNPTQPSSYLVGKLAILSIRERYEARAGAAFDLKTFHDELLDTGSIQPALVEAALGFREL